jgi:hypothetical protein|tara:strand:+ start:268 stop:561 length:294 start_codon:yes stop_codon:yes gene_type:complete
MGVKMSDDVKVGADPRFSLQSYQGILHVCEDVLKNYRLGVLEKKDVDAMMSVVTVSRQTLSDKSRYSQKKNPVMQESDVSNTITSGGPFNVFNGGVK